MVKKPVILFILIILGISGVVAYTTPYLVEHTRIGLEFKGGYEILYTAEPLEPGKVVDRDALLKTADILEKRANTLGVSEPQVTLEGDDQIRVKLAGISSNEQVRAIMNTASGLPLKLTEKYSQTVGGVLGESAFEQTKQAGIIALALIFLFIGVFYRGAGLVACFTLITYLWLLLLGFYLLNATLSLAAVVAFVLGMGIAADSNILAYERIKEEMRKEKPILSSLKDGEHNAFRTIMHSNITTIIAAIVLFFVGIGPISGFALTMIISISVSIVANVFLSRLLLNLLVRSNVVRSPAFFGVRKKVSPDLARRFDFVKNRNKFFVISTFIAAVGIVMLFTTELNYDIDFKAGTALDITLNESINQTEAEGIMEDAGIEPATVAIGGNDDNHIAARFDDVLEEDDVSTIIGAFKEDYGENVVYEENTYDPAVAQELTTKAMYAVAIAIIGIVAFVTIRFEWRFAIAATVTILNSAFFVIAMFAIFKFEIDVTFIAAILTVIGYSTNNTIVVFHRIRENLKLSTVTTGQELASLVNRSVWQTMTRSINTVLTVIIASICLLAFGAEPLQMFSLAILFGLICGAYSSIFIATPVWFLLKKKSLKVITAK